MATTPTPVTIPLKHLKVTLPLSPSQIPRDVLPPEGAPSVDHELLFALEGPPGAPALVLRGRVNSKNLRKVVKSIDALQGKCIVLMQGKLSGAGELVELGFVAQEKKEPPPSPPPNPQKGT